MARNFADETEFGLGLLPDPFGETIAEGSTGIAAITGLTDADAIKAGAGGVNSVGAELRVVYATPDDKFATGVGNAEFNPVKK